jgi:hypothetical protein
MTIQVVNTDLHCYEESKTPHWRATDYGGQQKISVENSDVESSGKSKKILIKN